MSIDTDQIQKNQIVLLLDSQKLLSKCSISELKEPFIIPREVIMTENFSELLKKIKSYCSGIKENLIYTIALEKPFPVEKIQQALINYKKENKHALSKVNLPTTNWEESGSILYVGSSKGSNFSTRIQNHLGIGSAGVYSLHLIHWLSGIIDSDIVIRTFTMEEPNHQLKNINLLEIIEQGFWDELKPMFGKRSGLL